MPTIRFISVIKVVVLVSMMVMCGCRDGTKNIPHGDFALQTALIDDIVVLLQADSPDMKLAREKLVELRRHIVTSDRAWCDMVRRYEDALERAGRIEQFASIKSLEIYFHSRLRDADEDGTIDMLLMAVAPKDPRGNAVKAPGIFSFELCKPGLLGGCGRVLRTWEFSAEQIDALWRSEMVVYPGYEFPLSVGPGLLKRMGRQGYVRVTFTPVFGSAIEVVHKVEVKG